MLCYSLSKCAIVQINVTTQVLFSKQIVQCLRNVAKGSSQSFHSYKDERHSWSVISRIYEGQFKNLNRKYACFLLNIDDKCPNLLDKYRFIWDEADLKVAVDGSANYLSKTKALHTADVVSGDFDSIDRKLLERLRCPQKTSKHVAGQSPGKSESDIPQIIETPCQKDTDFTKALRVAVSLRPNLQYFFGLYHSDGTRIDHLFGLINTLHSFKKNIFILNLQGGTLSWVLQSGSHAILKRPGQELCSLVPFVGPAEVKTQGLQYNMNQSSAIQFGGMISTSNFCKEHREKILIDTNREILWSIDLMTPKL